MRLSDLLSKRGVAFCSYTGEDLLLVDVTDDVRRVSPSSVFCAAKQQADDVIGGVEQCQLAAELGAQVVIIDDNEDANILALSDYAREKVVVVRVDDARRFYSELTSYFYPQRPEVIVGVTGTNGKTSVVNFLHDIWMQRGIRAASLGTSGLMCLGRMRSYLSVNATTYDARSTHMMLERMVTDFQITHVALEATARGLHQHRLSGINFQVAGFTNLTPDHLDYHGTMQEYAERKATLFTQRIEPGGVAVISVADPFGEILKGRIKGKCGLISFSPDKAIRADVRIISTSDVSVGRGIINLEAFGKEYTFETHLNSNFQSINIAFSIAAAFASGIPFEEAIEAASALRVVPGRFQLVSFTPSGGSVIVDYAHTEDGLRSALLSAKALTGPTSSLSVVFGCGGDRDKSKRSLMGEVAASIADRIYITDDNPRSEDPASIRYQIMQGTLGKAQEYSNRVLAIQEALNDLRSGDVLLVAGKGAEDYQIVTDSSGCLKKIQMSDVGIIESYCGVLWGNSLANTQ